MKNTTSICINKMIEYNAPDIRRINHTLKVLGFASAIGQRESLNDQEMELLELGAVFHDIGIHNAEKIYNSTAGNYQQELGPDIARPILKEVGVDEEKIEKVLYLISHHHTYNLKENKVLQILIEADFIVNIDEKNTFAGGTYEGICKKVFVTKTGIEYINNLFADRNCLE